MEQTNKLPSRFQIGDEVLYEDEFFKTHEAKLFKVTGVHFTESKVTYTLDNGKDLPYRNVDSLDVSPVEKQELSDTIIE